MNTDNLSTLILNTVSTPAFTRSLFIVKISLTSQTGFSFFVLSSVSKLTPKRLLGMMFGVWFLANFFANLIGGWTASYIDAINEAVGLSGFFLVFTAIPIGAGLIMLLISPFLKKRMHGIH